MNFAKEEKLLTKIKRGKDADATRMETALLVSDTLEADMWKVQSVITSKDGNKNTYAKDKGNTLLKTMFNIDVYNDQTVDTVSKSKKTATFKVTVYSGREILNVFSVLSKATNALPATTSSPKQK